MIPNPHRTSQQDRNEILDLSSVVFGLRSDPIIHYLTEDRQKPLTAQCIRGLLNTGAIEYLCDRIFCADEKTFSALSTEFKIRSMIFEHAAKLHERGKKRGSICEVTEAAQLLSVFYERGVDVESKRNAPVTAQTILYTLQKKKPSEAISFALKAVNAGCRFKDSILAHTLMIGEEEVKTIEDIKRLVTFARAVISQQLLENSSYSVAFQTFLGKISGPNPLDQRISKSYSPNESVVQVGHRLLLAYELAMSFIDSHHPLNERKNSLLMNNLVRSLASYPIALSVERVRFSERKKYQGYTSISEKLGIEFRRNLDSSERLLSTEAAQLVTDTLRCSWRLASACISSIPSENNRRDFLTLDYTLLSTTVNQILLAVRFTDHSLDLCDCIELTALLKAALVIPETREKLHSEYVSDFVLSILDSPRIPLKVKTESALEIAAEAVQMRRGPNEYHFYRRVRQEYLEHRPIERRPLISRDDDLTYTPLENHQEALGIIERELARMSAPTRPTIHLKGGIG